MNLPFCFPPVIPTLNIKSLEIHSFLKSVSKRNLWATLLIHTVNKLGNSSFKRCVLVYTLQICVICVEILLFWNHFTLPPPLNVLLHLAPFLAMNLMIVMFAPEKLIYSLNSKAVPWTGFQSTPSGKAK